LSFEKEVLFMEQRKTSSKNVWALLNSWNGLIALIKCSLVPVLKEKEIITEQVQVQEK